MVRGSCKVLNVVRYVFSLIYYSILLYIIVILVAHLEHANIRYLSLL